MNIKLFQIYFKPEQLADIDPLLTPFDNTENRYPEQREYHNFMRLYHEGLTKDLDLWGAFGPRWQEKLMFPARDIFQSVQENPRYDVYLFNHGRVVDALTTNVWEHGDLYHTGIIEVAEHLIRQLGYDARVVYQLMDDKVTCYCSYFLATNAFWNEYLEFLTRAKEILDNLPNGDIKKTYLNSANYLRDQNLNLFPFIIERLFSTYLTINKNYRVYHRSYNYTEYCSRKWYNTSIANLLKSTSDLKNLINDIEDSNVRQTIYQCWERNRRYILGKYPLLVQED